MVIVRLQAEGRTVNSAVCLASVRPGLQHQIVISTLPTLGPVSTLTVRSVPSLSVSRTLSTGTPSFCHVTHVTPPGSTTKPASIGDTLSVPAKPVIVAADFVKATVTCWVAPPPETVQAAVPAPERVTVRV